MFVMSTRKVYVWGKSLDVGAKSDVIHTEGTFT